MFTDLGENGQAQEVKHVMDQPINIPNFDDDGDNVVLFQTPQPEKKPEVPAGPNGTEEGNKTGDNKLNAFEDLEAKPDGSAAADEDEELIKKLKEKGFKVEKEELENEDELFNRKLEQQEIAIQKSQEFINLPDAKLVSEKIKWDIAEKYRAVGKQHLIGTEEFEIEVEAEIDGYTSDDRMLKIFADNIRRDVKDGVLAKSLKAKDDLLAEKTKKIDAEINQKKANLRNSLNEIFNKGIFGMKFQKEDIQKAYDYISSGQFSKEIKDDPNSLAELALYRLNRDTIVSKIGGPTYGEGVAAAVKELEGSSKQSTSHISNAMQTHAGKGGEESISRNWSSVLAPDSEELKNKTII